MEVNVSKIAGELKIKTPDLITRSIGRAFYEKVRKLLRLAGSGETAIFDLERIVVMDSSFIDEFLVASVADTMRLEPDCFIKLRNISPISEINIDLVFRSYSNYKNKRIAVITDGICQNNSFYIGQLTSEESDIVEYLRINRSVSTEEISNFTGTGLSDIDQIMNGLFALRIVKREAPGLFFAV
ncbi:MAG: hypothetical protein MUD12_01990 [Spirochaetes bacterium]|jgi:hypothetical protein|nr:hypothetical protein [Spirochaetota bacterium]